MSDKPNKNQAIVTKGETYGVIYQWCVDVTVPPDWDEQKDRDYLENSIFAVESREDLLDFVRMELEGFHNVLTLANCFLTAQPYELEDCIFRHLPLPTRVEILSALIRKRKQDAGYLERLGCDLRRFLDVNQICMPLLQRCLLDLKSVWRRELLNVQESVMLAASQFAESMECEHEGCPNFHSKGWISPPPSGENSAA